MTQLPGTRTRRPMASAWCARLAVCLLLGPAGACAQERSPAPVDLFRTGQYAAAAAAAERQVAADSNNAAAAVLLLRALREVGRVSDAVQIAARLSARPALGSQIALQRGYALKARGSLSDAAVAFAAGGRGPDSLMVRYELALLAHERGDHAGARQQFDRFIDTYNAYRATLTATDLRAVALACRMLGREDPQLFKDALRAFDEANARDTLELDGRVQLAELFLEKFNGADARTALSAVLRVNPGHPRALLAMARLDAFDGRGSGDALVQRSLSVNGSSPEGRAQSAMQLIDVERYADAAAEAERGLTIDSTAPAPLIALAAARLLSGDQAGHQLALSRAHQRLAGSADAEVALADVAARNRLYKEAAAFAAAGVQRDPRSARSLALLGINRMRLGQWTEGGASLQQSFVIDPYDVWVKNTLDLVDTFKDYTELHTARFTIVAEQKDAALLDLFVGPLAEQAYDSLASRYGYRPPTPVRVELFRSHADFSVRTVGLAGLGALGVSFGGVVAMDSPAARKVGEFNWGSTLWHELTHTFTLGATDNRIPRWLSEGLSVYEERRARAGWGSDVSPTLIAAYKAGRLQPVSRLNDGFVRPRYAAEVTLSYALASFVCEMVEREHGVAGIRHVLQSYREGKATPAVFAEVAGVSGDALDQRFDAWFRRRFAAEFAAVSPRASSAGASDAEGGETDVAWEGPLYDAVRDARQAVAAQRFSDAESKLNAATGLFPAWADAGSAYHLLADLYQQRGDTARAIAALSAISDRNESAFEATVRLARLRRATGDARGAVAALARTLYITPFDGAVHDTLAVLAAATGDYAVAIRSRRALLAMAPTDRVEALYQLAATYVAAGDVAAARREVLRALDLAPNYEKAQELLLSLRKPEMR